MSRFFTSLICVVLYTFNCMVCMQLSAQTPEWRDTLNAAVKTDAHKVEMALGRISTDVDGVRSVVSPMGEGDPIRWAQSLPGVTTGADGTTSMYVRGGNAGNNMLTLDGVPVYGYSHILGLTTIIPNNIIGSLDLCKGGFDGSENNFTAGHMRIVTKTPESKQHTSFAVNNFLASASTEGPIGNKFSYIVSARVSPLTYEYRTMQKFLPKMLGGMDDFAAKVGDVYAKLHFQINDKQILDGSFLGSLDRYAFNTSDNSHEMMDWINLVGMVRYRYTGKRTHFETTVSANGYGTSQQQEKTYRGELQHLDLKSSLEEYGLKANLRHCFLKGRLVIGEGVNIRYAGFSPGQMGTDVKKIHTRLTTGWLNVEFNVPEILSIKAVARADRFGNYDMKRTVGQPYGNPEIHNDMEYSFSVKWNITRDLAFEGTFDKMMQYYHTLEGLPVGWSLDMVVPTGKNVLPESSLQGSAGFSGHFGAHDFSVGGFYREMENLIYYKYSQALFNGALSAWEDHVELGNGRSYGLEFLYEFQKKDWYGRVTYTLSKTTREDFPSFYEGRPFHARFDRRHVLNATAQWKGVNASFILQSGHWENGAAETYGMPAFWTDGWEAKYYSGVNNYHMPMVVRLDLGYQFDFTTGPVKHSVNVGICNVTNRFNPFMLYFDTATESWKEIALLPILPNFSWRISF